MKTIVLAGGCFWGVEKFLSLVNGITFTETAFVNGNTETTTYEEVCKKDTGYAEGVKIQYDPSFISLEEILDLYYQIIDPTSLNKQGNDVGTQYRTGIYYVDVVDEPLIKDSLIRLQSQYKTPIAIELEPLKIYVSAEKVHQKYLDNNPNGYCHIGPKFFELAKNYKKK